MTSGLHIRPARAGDREAIAAVHRAAFGAEGESIVGLLEDLDGDPTARPSLSLVAEADGEPCGHVLFTPARIEGGVPRKAVILAPLGVHPSHHRAGVGRALVEEGLRRSREAGNELVFVLGDPAYYGRFGFEPSTEIAAPLPLPPEYNGAWRVLALIGAPPDGGGTLRCARSLERPEHW